MGGAAFEEDLGRLAVERGLAESPAEVAALETLAEFGFVSNPTITRFRGDVGAHVLSLGEQDSIELLRIGAKVRRVLGRRGIASVAEVAMSLANDKIPASDAEIRSYIERARGIEYLGRRDFFWRPLDSDSAFVRRLEKPLVVLGPQTSHALARALRRLSRRETYGPVIPTVVLVEALQTSTLFGRTDGDRWEWKGPARPVPLGVAEAPLIELLRRDGPALSYPEIRTRLIDVEGVTLSVALSHSPLVERVAPGVYALAGARLLPGDVEDARIRAKDQVPVVQLVETVWERGAAVVRWDILDRRLWNGVLNAPSKAGLQGSWVLRGDRTTWVTTVEGGTVWGGIGIWMSLQKIQYPARLTLRFDPADRHIDPEISTLHLDE
jgi:hypothetical protein